MPPSAPPLLFIASLGNPGAQYALTRHSAGHILLSALAAHISAPPLACSRHGKGRSTSATVLLPPIAGRTKAQQKGQRKGKGKHKTVSGDKASSGEADDGAAAYASRDGSPITANREPATTTATQPSWSEREALRLQREELLRPVPAQWTLWSSGAYMNESGPGVVQAFRSFVMSSGMSSASDSGGVPTLVVLHDSLEHAPGSVTVRNGAQGFSHKGHNGIRSLVDAVKGAGLVAVQDWVKVSVGIGRPTGRGQAEVSAFVLGKMTEAELGRLRTQTVERLYGELCKIGR